LLRSSSMYEPSDPLNKLIFTYFFMTLFI